MCDDVCAGHHVIYRLHYPFALWSPSLRVLPPHHPPSPDRPWPQTHTDLRQAQNAYESLSYALRAVEEGDKKASAKEKGALEAQAREARDVLKAAAARLSRVEEHAQVCLYGGLHYTAMTH